MPHNVYPNASAEHNGQVVQFSYECWSNHQGEAVVAVHGKTDADHSILAQNRAWAADLVKRAEDIRELRYYESQGNGLYTPMSLETDRSGRVTGAAPVHGASVSGAELNQQGQQLLEQEHQHNMDLSAHSFSERSAQQYRNDPGHDSARDPGRDSGHGHGHDR